jgi:hypothetical protein
MFGDDRRRLLQLEIGVHVQRASQTLRQHYPDLLPPASLVGPPADGLRPVLQAVLMHELLSALRDRPSVEVLAPLFAAAEAWQVTLDLEVLGYALTETVNRWARALAAQVESDDVLHDLAVVRAGTQTGPQLPVNRWLPLFLTDHLRRSSAPRALPATSMASTPDDGAQRRPVMLLEDLIRLLR